MSRPIHVLALTRYDSTIASSRQRFFRVGRELEGLGFRITFQSLIPGKNLPRVFKGHGSAPFGAAPLFLNRAATLLGKRDVDLLWVQYEVFPFLPTAFDTALLPHGIPLVLDLDDAMFLRYAEQRSVFARTFLKTKFPALARRASLVTVGNGFLARWFSDFGSRVEILPTSVDLRGFPIRALKREFPEGRPFTIGWIGSPTTSQYLRPLFPILEDFFRQTGTGRLLVVGARSLPRAEFPVEMRNWNQEREFADLREMDVGIMPLSGSDWERGKCGFKLIQYMAAGLPVMASPVGVNVEMVEQGKNGFTAVSREEWVDGLSRLRSDPELRFMMGRAGRDLVEKRFSLGCIVPRVAALFRELVERGGVEG